MPTRRRLLQAASLVPLGAIAACSSDATSGGSDVDDSVRQQVATNENDLLARYDATMAAFPALSDQLQPIRQQHFDHLTSVGGDVVTTGLKEPKVPASQTAALSELASAERAAATARRASCVSAANADLAWNLALIAASESQHVSALVKAES